jgi:charged multivesicular body protein 3
VREWSSKLRKQTYLLDRQIRSIQREEAKVKLSLKQAAKKGDADVCRILAKEIVNSRKAVNRIHASKAQLNSVSLHMNQQAANLRVAGVMEKSADVMKAMHSLIRVHEISDVMRELSKEMTKAGIMEEMMDETMESTSGMDEDEMEEEAQKEVDKVLFELTEGELCDPLSLIISFPHSL